MNTLIDFIEEAFHSYGGYHGQYKSVSEFIGNDEKCLRLIYQLLDLGRDDISVLHKKNFNRASHIIVTLLLGIGIENKQGVLTGVNSFNPMPDEYLWMLTALLHDYGYFRKELLVSKSLDQLGLKYNLLTDEYHDEPLKCLNGYSNNFSQYCTFSYDTINNYYEYRRNHIFINDENGEINDHGIMGACIAFSQYVQFYLKHEVPRINKRDKRIMLLQETEPLLYKTACLMAAQHNLFKSESTERDFEYGEYRLTQLLSTSPIRINERNPLLLMLALVDTIECSKRFSKKANPKKYLKMDTILNRTLIDVSDEQILIDFSKLYEFIDKKNNVDLLSQLEKHIRNIMNLGSWTSYEAQQTEPFMIVIRKMN